VPFFFAFFSTWATIKGMVIIGILTIRARRTKNPSRDRRHGQRQWAKVSLFRGLSPSVVGVGRCSEIGGCPVSEPEQLSQTQVERLADTAEWMCESPGEADTFLRHGIATALASIIDPLGSRTRHTAENEKEQQAARHTVLAHALHFGCSRYASARARACVCWSCSSAPAQALQSDHPVHSECGA
jgi:hypothetical protein